MNEQFPINRVEIEFSQWKAREERFSTLFSITPADNKSLLAEKLRQFERIRAKYKSSKNIEEQHSLRILKMESSRMSKQLYPSLISRFFRKIITASQNQISIGSDVKKAEKNFNSLQEQMQRIGFPDLSEKLKMLIEKAQENFSLSLSYYINETEKINHNLSFSKNAEGYFELEGYKSSLYNNSILEENKQHYFKNEQGYNFKLHEVHNLLFGRSVYHNESWFQIDFNDKDAAGNNHLKEFRNGYGYDLEKTLKAVPLKAASNKFEFEKLKNTLKQGDRISAVLIKNGKEQLFRIEADPHFKTLTIYDQHLRKVEINSLRRELQKNHEQNQDLKLPQNNQSRRTEIKI